MVLSSVMAPIPCCSPCFTLYTHSFPLPFHHLAPAHVEITAKQMLLQPEPCPSPHGQKGNGADKWLS